MDLRLGLAIIVGKLVNLLTRFLGCGQGSAAPGLTALKIDPGILRKLSKKIKNGSIIVSGTNGKTTTTKLITEILKASGYKVVHNREGSNLNRGLVSTLLKHSDILGNLNFDVAVWELDEAAAISIFEEVNPKLVVLLNFFRDQLDRYGEVDSLVEKWREKLEAASSKIKLVLNADDPGVAAAGSGQRNVWWFGIDEKKYDLGRLPHAADSIHCLKCGSRLGYKAVYLSHLGDWFCPKCSLARPPLDSVSEGVETQLVGAGFLYDILAAKLAVRYIGVKDEIVNNVLKNFRPAFGRQEELEMGGRRIKIMLSKNPAGFNENLNQIQNSPADSAGKIHNLLFILNDRIADGRDVSWIWDVDFEESTDLTESIDEIVVSGTRARDLEMRLRYAGFTRIKRIDNLKGAVKSAVEMTKKGETLYILPTYTAMLEVRKILLKRKF